MGAGTYPPLVSHGPNDRGAVVVVVTYSFMFTTILFAIVRAWISRSRKWELRWDDLAWLVAVLLLIAESILTERAVDSGLGRRSSNVVAPQLVQYYKYEYAAQMLGIVIQTLAKFSAVLLVERIAPELSTTKRSLVLKSLIGVWAVFSFFTIAFQCGLPRPWEFTHDKCAAHGELYYAVIAGNIATDVLTAFYIIPTVLELQMGRSRKITVSSMFLVRLVVCALSFGYLALFPRYLSSSDKTWHNAMVQILNQVVVNLSIITAGVPSVRSYLADLQTGKLALVLDGAEIEMTSRGSKSKTAGGRSTGGQGSSGGHNSRLRRQSKARALESAQALEMRPDITSGYMTHITGGATERHADKTRDNIGPAPVHDEEVTGDDKSTSSLVKHGVFQKRDFEVRIE